MDALEPGNLAPDVPPRLKAKLAWRWNRLRSMSVPEIGHRVLRAAQARAERAGLRPAPEMPPPDLATRAVPWIRTDAAVDRRAYAAAAERIAEGWLDVFALRDVDVGAPPRWNRDPKSGIEAPLAFGKLLDYRDPDRVGDIKYLWEPNRHLQLVTLAQAFSLTREPRYLHAIQEQLESWWIACPYGMGPNWTSALEAALRLVNWSAAWQLIGPAELEAHAEFRQRWLRSVYQHAEFVRGWLSRYSSANNHLIGEAAGLFLAGLTWPHWPRAQRWVTQAKAILEREALAQNAPDGVNREQAVWYQQSVLELLLVCLLAGKANGQWFSPDYESRIEAMLDFIASIMDAGGNVPMFGDADDGVALGLAVSQAHFRWLLASGALLFQRGDFKAKAGALDDKTRWLFGAQADARFAALDPEKTRLPPRQAFPEGGYYVLGCGLETEDEIRIVADAGALGYRSIAAHGHADALSFTLSAAGREILVDPGTYAYHTQERWRRYFRGTAAHNTIRVDALDQSEQAGTFLWRRKARAGCSLWLSSALKDSFEGWHDGYGRLADPVKHRRLIELDKRKRRILVEDSLEMAGAHDIELVFHCSERCEVEPVEGGYRIAEERVRVRLVLPAVPGAQSHVYRGSLEPVFGWISRGYDRREPAPSIVWRARLDAPSLLRSELWVGEAR